MNETGKAIHTVGDLQEFLRVVSEAKRDGLLDHGQAKTLWLDGLRAMGFTVLSNQRAAVQG